MGADRPPPEPSLRPPELVAASERPVDLDGAPATVAVAMDREAVSRVERALGAPSPVEGPIDDPVDDVGDPTDDEMGDDSPGQVLLNVEDMVAAHAPSVVHGVFLSRRDDPSARSRHVGNLAPFGIEHANDPDRPHAGTPGFRHTFDVTAATADLLDGRTGDLSQLEVTFRVIMPRLPDGTSAPTPEPGSIPSLTIGRVSFFVT